MIWIGKYKYCNFIPFKYSGNRREFIEIDIELIPAIFHSDFYILPQNKKQSKFIDLSLF